MNKTVLAALAAAALIPTAAMARPVAVHHDTVVVATHTTPIAYERRVHETRLVVGGRIEPSYLAQRYRIANPAREHLQRAGHREAWVRVDGRAVLVNAHSGRIIRIAGGRFG